MTQVQQDTNLVSEQHDDLTRAGFAVPEEHEADEITDLLDSINGGMPLHGIFDKPSG